MGFAGRDRSRLPSPVRNGATCVADYHFVSTWALGAPASDVFAALRDYATYPEWWPDVCRVDLAHDGGGSDVGMVVRVRVKSPLFYSLSFDVELVEVAEPTLISTRASGHLVGTGVWRLVEVAGGTVASYTWDVATTRPWMNLLAPVARPAFSAAHESVMRRGARGLTSRLGVPLLDEASLHLMHLRRASCSPVPVPRPRHRGGLRARVAKGRRRRTDRRVFRGPSNG